jgi:DNA-binding NarL/FixJ family response regulator
VPSTVRQVVEGTVYHPRGRGGDSGSAPAANAGHPGGLTDRELSILRLVAEGLSNLDIASKLYVTEQTVKFHLSNIYRKLGVGNRTEATRYAYRNGLIE